ncbi:hypothetical protein RB195_012796 [Necator americanus]|uniref:Uncharacterized protein n=1 Tax=Necator americanus TaxID=51031 RepID=A0ABR1DTT6_NECAM
MRRGETVRKSEATRVEERKLVREDMKCGAEQWNEEIWTGSRQRYVSNSPRGPSKKVDDDRPGEEVGAA